MRRPNGLYLAALATLPWLCFGFLARSETAQATGKLLGGASRVQIANGTIGVLHALAIYEIKDSCHKKALLIVTSDEDFAEVDESTRFAEEPVRYDVANTRLRLALLGMTGGRIYGHVLGSGQHVFVESAGAYESLD